MKHLADMHVAPPLRRWLTRLGLALVVAIVIGYVPGQLMRRDPREERLTERLEALRAEGRELAARNAVLYREVNALRTDVGAIEDRARGDLGMVYPDEVVLRVRRDPATIEIAKKAAPAKEPTP
ncbi:MAG TPA: septum formation initiator family protein [Kofleriaceae bacterium]